MAKFSIPIPGLIHGVSQQAPSLRLPGQAELQTNFYPSPTDGLVKRHPINHVARIDENVATGLVHAINRSPGEQYITLIGDTARVFETDGTEVPVFGPLSAGAPYTPDFTYLTVGSPPDIRSLKALTLVDYTLVLNRECPAEMSTVLSDPDPSDQTAFLFVRAGQYTTRYEATLKLVGSDAVKFEVTTWDGVTAPAGVNEQWRLTVLTPGATNDVWTVTILGNTASYTVQGGDNATAVASALATAIAALPGVTASSSLGIVTITADVAGQHFTPGVGSGGTGTFTTQQMVVGTLGAQLTSIETNDIAQALADLISADPRFTVTTVGSVVRVDVMASAVDYAIWNLTVTHKGGSGTVWTVDMLSQTATYTEQVGDTDTDVAIGLTAAIDALTGSTATRHNKTITITDTTITEDFTPVVTVASPAAFTLVKIADPAADAPAFDSVRCEDSRGGADAVSDNAFLSVHRSVDAINLLPLTCSDGFRIKINGGTADIADDYYVEFEADSDGEFGKGKWVESYGFEIPFSLDATTMPHALIRRVDDISGTVTGTPNAKYFEWGPIDWDMRTVGDESTSPHPSIADGLPIADMFFFRGRLGFVSGQKVVMSEVNRFFNLFRTTVLSLLDGDPIDILVPHHTAISLNRAKPFNQTLILFSDRVLFKLDAETILTPKTVQVSSIADYENDRQAEPYATERGVFFTHTRNGYSGLRQLRPDSQVVGQFSIDDVSVVVPQYIPGQVVQMAANEAEGLLLVKSNGNLSKFFALKTYVRDGQLQQLAWFQYQLNNFPQQGITNEPVIVGMDFIGTTLFIVIVRGTETFLESSTILSDQRDTDNSPYLTYLDRRTVLLDGVFDSVRTTWTLPYSPDTDETYVAVIQGTDTVLPLTLDGGNDVSTAGNYETDNVWIGQLYDATYRFSKLYLKSGDASRGSQVAKSGGRLQVLQGVVRVNNSRAFSAVVTPYLRSAYQTDFDAATNLQGLHLSDEDLPLADGEFRFGVFSDDAQVDLSVPGPLPAAFQSAEFEVDWTVQYPQFRG